MNDIFSHNRPLRRLRGRHLLLLLIVLISTLHCGGWSAATAATTPAEENTTTTAPEPKSAGHLEDTRQTPSLAIASAKALGALAVVLGLLMLLAAALKKLGLSGQSPQGEGLIKVLDTKMLAPKKYVAVVDIAGQALAVGVSDQQITLLTKLEPHQRLEALAQKSTTSSRFQSLLSKAVNNTKKTP